MSELGITIDEALDLKVAGLPVVAAAALAAAEEIAAIARETAEVNTGAYRDGIITQAFNGGARVLAQDFKSGWIEFGAPANGLAPTFNLRNAVLAAGYHFKKSHA